MMKEYNLKIQILLLILFVFASLDTKAQQTEIVGKILSETDSPLIGATIIVNDSIGTVSGRDGLFELKTKSITQAVTVQVRRIGYETLDTLIQTKALKTYLELRLKKAVYTQPEVEVLDKKITKIFDKKDWVILDLKVYQDFLFLIYLEGDNRYVGRAKTNGVFIDKVIVTEKYDRMKEACTGSLYFLARDGYAILKMETDSIFELEASASIADIKDYIEPCLFKVDNKYLFKSYARHNKVVNYFRYNEAKKTELVIRLYDQAAAEVAQSYYREIIGMYHHAVAYPSPDAIDAGIQRENLIARGEWSGDLMDLVINTDIHFAVSYYQNIEARPTKTLEFLWEEEGYVFDHLNQMVYRVSTSSGAAEPLYMKGDYLKDKKADYQIIQDKARNINYLIDDKDQLFYMKITNDDVSLTPAFTIEEKFSFVKYVCIHDGVLYYVYKPDRTSPFTQIKTKKLD
ncbi:MAG: carboxypeptidase-like regulatory domain-containing protein [Saprospiraceae bacterium]